MDIDAWLKKAKTEIDALDAELIALCNFAPEGLDRSWLMAHLDEPLETVERRRATDMVRRRKRGVPMAYILEEKEFYGRRFLVTPAVLIPRPETEVLIDLIKGLNLAPRQKFLEIGTGSGCIAVTLALEFPQSFVMAADINSRALDVALYNNLRHEGRVELSESNLLDNVDFNTGKDMPAEHFDVVVANLPYVNKEWDWLDTKSLGHEPASALYARGHNGLSVYQRFLKELYHYWNENVILYDYLVVEADPCQHAELIKMAEKRSMVHLKTEGYGLVFEHKWRYWYDHRTDKFVRKPDDVIQWELVSRNYSFIPDELMGEE